MTAADVLQLRDRERCPVCRNPHCLTTSRRLWVHGPRHNRCRGSALTLTGARYAATSIRGITTIHLPGETP